MSNIKISIIVPNFNHAHYLPTCLDSILAQKASPHEVILIDDKSTDNSVEVMQSYADKSPIFKIITNKINLGVEKSVNSVFELITGTHMIFLAADDWMCPSLLAEAYSMLEQHPTAGLWSAGSWIIYEDDTSKLFPIKMNYPIKKAGYIPANEAKEYLYKLDSWFAGNTIVHNKKYFELEKGYDPKLKSFADGMLYKILVSKYGCCFTPKRLGVWRIRRESNSQVHSNQVSSMLSITEATMNKIQAELSEILPAKLISRIHNRLLFATAKTMWDQHCTSISPELDALLRNKYSNRFSYLTCKNILKICGKLPVINNITGKICLLTYYKPFDIINLIRINTVQRLNIA